MDVTEPGMTNGRTQDARWTNAPWWASLLKQVGVPAAAMLGLLVFVLNAWSEDRDRLVISMQAQTDAIVSMRENLLLHAQDSAYLVKSLERIHSVNMAACLNAASDEPERNRCINGAGR